MQTQNSDKTSPLESQPQKKKAESSESHSPLEKIQPKHNPSSDVGINHFTDNSKPVDSLSGLNNRASKTLHKKDQDVPSPWEILRTLVPQSSFEETKNPEKNIENSSPATTSEMIFEKAEEKPLNIPEELESIQEEDSPQNIGNILKYYLILIISQSDFSLTAVEEHKDSLVKFLALDSEPEDKSKQTLECQSVLTIRPELEQIMNQVVNDKKQLESLLNSTVNEDNDTGKPTASVHKFTIAESVEILGRLSALYKQYKKNMNYADFKTAILSKLRTQPNSPQKQ